MFMVFTSRTTPDHDRQPGEIQRGLPVAMAHTFGSRAAPLWRKAGETCAPAHCKVCLRGLVPSERTLM